MFGVTTFASPEAAPTDVPAPIALVPTALLPTVPGAGSILWLDALRNTVYFGGLLERLDDG